MGMYTELHYNVELRKAVPAKVIEVLKYMLDNDEPCEGKPNHPLFVTDRWPVMLRMSSAYFPARTHSELFEEYGQWHLGVRCNLKNYCGEIEKFIDWLDPYVEAFEGDFLGFHRYEESEEPVVIRKGSARNTSDSTPQGGLDSPWCMSEMKLIDEVTKLRARNAELEAVLGERDGEAAP
jgi:hypothetical protein